MNDDRRSHTEVRGRPSRDDTGTVTAAEPLASRLSALARSWQREGDVTATVQAIVAAAVAQVPGAEQASVSSTGRRRNVVTLASTGDVADQVDQAQYETGQGPCLDSLDHQCTVRLSDLIEEERWPAFTERANVLGVGSMLAVQLYVEEDDLGALNLLSSKPHAFDDRSEHVALLFASHAAVAMAAALRQGHLREALLHRDVIGQAKGMMIERFKVSDEQAFGLLVATSQRTNHKLHQVAADVVRGRRLPQGDLPRTRRM